MATEEELKEKLAEWNALPLEMQACFKEGFDMLIGRPYILTLNENGGVALVRHLKKHGLEIRPIKDSELVEEFINFVRHAPVSSGVCCCGMSMENHPEAMDSGHIATDQWHYDISQWLIQLGVE